jgi:hypothetical protein
MNRDVYVDLDITRKRVMALVDKYHTIAKEIMAISEKMDDGYTMVLHNEAKVYNTIARDILDALDVDRGNG